MNDRLLWAASVGYRKVIKQKFLKISYRIVSWSKAHMRLFECVCNRRQLYGLGHIYDIRK